MTLDQNLYHHLCSKRSTLATRTFSHVESTYDLLKQFGFSDRQISTNAVLLEYDPDTLSERYDTLVSKLGTEKIPSRGRLLCVPSATMIDRYNVYVDRVNDRIIKGQPQLLQLPKHTFFESVSWHDYHEVGIGNGAVIGVSAPRKTFKVEYAAGILRCGWSPALALFQAKPSYLQKGLQEIEKYVIRTNTERRIDTGKTV